MIMDYIFMIFWFVIMIVSAVLFNSDSNLFFLGCEAVAGLGVVYHLNNIRGDDG